MCGIAGALHRSHSRPRSPSSPQFQGMVDALAHRGPDSAGIWVDEGAGIALGHRRLAIIDLSDAGAQPMSSHDGRWVLVFNGEIYNFADLREELGIATSAQWRGHSDTEVLLAAIGHWGLRGALERVDGMFAFAAWDRQNGILHLARDRFGEKPLYVLWTDALIAFASEVRSFEALGDFRPTASRAGLSKLLWLGYIPAPWSPYESVYKIPPGTWLSISSHAASPSDAEAFENLCQPFWSATAAASHATSLAPFDSVDAALAGIEAALQSSIQRRLVADVPVGAFLSGGIDSSLVVALMSKVAARRPATFTIAFDDADVDESTHAERVAQLMGTHHHVARLRSEDALEKLSAINHVYDEPLADSSQLPTMLLCETTRRSTKVVLSGDGGDELFFGYQRQFNAFSAWRKFGRVPRAGRRLIAGLGMQACKAGIVDRRWMMRRCLLLGASDTAVLHAAMSTHWPMAEPLKSFTSRVHDSRLDAMSNIRLFDQAHYLPGALMPKVDRASMSVGLEVRLPFLEPGVLEASWRTPGSMLFREGQGKWILRRLLERHLPSSIVDRPKQGFAVPLGRWLRQDLHAWASTLIRDAETLTLGLIDTEMLGATWRRHCAGIEDASDVLWTALTMMNWLSARPHLL